MKLFGPSAVKRAAKEMSEAMELLTADLNDLKKRFLNGHHDVQINSEIYSEPYSKEPLNGPSNGNGKR